MVAMSKVPAEDKSRLRYGVEEGSLLQLTALAVPFALFALTARWVIPLVFGHQWAGTITVYAVLTVAAVLAGPNLIQITLLFSKGKNADVAMGAAVQLVVLAGASALLVHWFGIVGFGLATLVSLVGQVVVDRMVRRITDFSYRALLPFAVALVPLALVPVLPLPLAPLLFIPMAVVACVPSVRAEGVHMVRLVTASLKARRA
jgi:O-antigen/teichoic acid export membrane protein